MEVRVLAGPGAEWRSRKLFPCHAEKVDDLPGPEPCSFETDSSPGLSKKASSFERLRVYAYVRVFLLSCANYVIWQLKAPVPPAFHSRHKATVLTRANLTDHESNKKAKQARQRVAETPLYNGVSATI